MKQNMTSKVEHSLTVGADEPVLLQDTTLHETLETFVNEKILERAVHVKGYGAFGYFRCTRSMKAYTKACFLQREGQITRTFSRFSLAVSTKGTPDTSRNVRGFSTKFYLGDKIFDLLCNHIPVFLVRDAIKFPRAIKSLSPSPINNLPDPEAFWCFVAENPEAMHFLTWLYSDLGTLDNLRCMRAYGVNTYIWVNTQEKRYCVKYHMIPVAGTKTIDRKEAIRLAGDNPNIAGEDLYKTLAGGKTVEYDFCVQLIPLEEAASIKFDIFDDTKIWSEEDYPLIRVGRLTLEKNPDDYEAQVEKAAFSPANLIDGIELSKDKMLQGRSFIYWDAQRRRLGSEFRKIPVNSQKCWTPNSLVTSGEGISINGEIQRSEISNPDNFSQAGEHYLSLCEEQKEHLIDNIASELYQAASPVKSCILKYLYQSYIGLGSGVEEKILYYQNQSRNRR